MVRYSGYLYTGIQFGEDMCKYSLLLIYHEKVWNQADSIKVMFYAHF